MKRTPENERRRDVEMNKGSGGGGLEVHEKKGDSPVKPIKQFFFCSFSNSLFCCLKNYCLKRP